MAEAILVRVTPENYSARYEAHAATREARLEYGITDGPLYRDEADPNTVLIHLDVESLERAKGWFRDDRFKESTARADNVRRQAWFASTPSA